MPLFTLRRQSRSAAAHAWFASASGQALLASEDDAVRVALRRRLGQASLWLTPGNIHLPLCAETMQPLRLYWADDVQLHGDVQCQLPLPLATESMAQVFLQHAVEITDAPDALLEECARVLLPGGCLWLLALNPLSPYRLRWMGQGLDACEPVTWRRRLRAVGLQPDVLTQGLGPSWDVRVDPHVQDGVGLRAAFLLRAEKRKRPLTPIRKRQHVLAWQARQSL